MIDIGDAIFVKIFNHIASITISNVIYSVRYEVQDYDWFLLPKNIIKIKHLI